MTLGSNSKGLTVVEICAGAGGQSLGLHRAGFDHALAVEIDANAAATLRANTDWDVAVGDVADSSVWRPADYEGVDLFAGGVPCPPFSIAGQQLGTSDERDLFAWSIEQVAHIKPRALLLENVRGLASSRFAGYRQHVLDRLAELGYVGDWRLLTSADYGVPQLRPRFVLVAMRPDDASHFYWPEPSLERLTIGDTLREDMASAGWRYADDWAALAQAIGPTVVGGSKKHGGADLGPTRAKRAWAELAVDARGIANEAPAHDAPHPSVVAPRLTIGMVAKVQGWREADDWHFTGGKTSQYRQIGNAFPPPVAEAIGKSIASALLRETEARDEVPLSSTVHDPIYRALSSADGFVPIASLISAATQHSRQSVERRLAALSRDFEMEVVDGPDGVAYRLGAFRGFVGQSEHGRHDYFVTNRNRIS